MVDPRGFRMLSHVLYVDAIITFCRASKKSLSSLLVLFSSYEQVSSHVISKEKSKFYTSNIRLSRITAISALLGFSMGTTPFNYLGAPLFKEKPWKIHLLPITDIMKAKLSS